MVCKDLEKTYDMVPRKIAVGFIREINISLLC